MHDKFHLYQAFLKIATALGEINGLSIKETKKVLNQIFSVHANLDEVLSIVNKVSFTDDNLDFLFDDCIRICDELGPSREYFTLINQLEDITIEMATKGSIAAQELSNKVLVRFKEEITLINQKIPHPPLFNILLEGRSLIEWTSIYAIYPFIPKRIKGNGHPVL